ncbi:MAG: tetratricopeptide repeat protein, partial [Candidatus Eremiobacterota bacterium]
ALNINDDVYQVWNNKGLACYKLKKYEESIKCFEKALSINPGYTTAWYNKGSALFMMKNYNGAIVCFDKVLSQDPGHSGAKNKKEQSQAALDSQKSIKGFIDKGMASYNQGKYDDAVSYYDKALTLDPVNETALVKKGDALAKQGKYDKALECYNKVFAVKPDFPDIQAKIEETEKSVTGQKTPAPVSETYKEFYDKGCTLYKEGHFEEALKNFQQSLNINQQYVPALFKKGFTLITLSRGKNDEKNKEVIKCFLEINKLDPDMKECDINGTDDRGSTPLHIATAIENEILARELIKNGADVNIKNNNGDTPLHLAAKNYSRKKDLRKKEIEIANMLINKGADVNSKNNDGFTPLHNASAAGNIKMAELLISKGADVNSKDKNGNTPLKKAGTSEMKDLLRANGAKE